MNKLMIPVVLACAAFSAQADIHLSNLFSDRAVLQRGKPLPIWGTAEPCETVTVSFNGATAEGKADAAGKWTAVLPVQDVLMEGKELSVAGSVSKSVKRTDVLVGDVWLISGQSNAEMPFNWGIINGKEEMAKAKGVTTIRTAKFHHKTSLLPVSGDPCCTGWMICEPGVLPGVTAMGYFMARELNEKSGVPIGILDCNWSGCRIEPFMSAEGLLLDPATKDGYARQLAAYKTIGDFAKFFSTVPEGKIVMADKIADIPSLPYAMQYNAMIEPIVRFPIAGATWYQGCSNGGEGQTYLEKLRSLVAGWRAKWGYDFPFYIVQLASYTAKTTDPAGGNGYAKIRNAQRIAAQTIPRAGLAVVIDIGNAKDIHPKNKLDVGHRLALWARRDVYGEKDLVVSGPLYTGMKVEGGAIRVSFDYADGLFAGEKGPDTPGVQPVPETDGVLKGFAIAGADKKWYWAQAKVDGKTVVVSAPEVKEPVAVRYAFRANPMGDCNLYNAAGLPASPFRTDSW